MRDSLRDFGVANDFGVPLVRSTVIADVCGGESVFAGVMVLSVEALCKLSRFGYEIA
jgi:hypothetical protein